MEGFVVVYVTAPSRQEAERLQLALVEERLAACVTRIASVSSVYRWEGKIERSDEELLVVKTAKETLPRLKQRVRELHSYSVPEIVALPIVDGDEPYLRWLAEQVAREER
jgi:periplasmic divalent cation tolerance protein